MRASTARLMNSPVRLADLTFPQVNRLIHRTRLAFIHLDNLLAFGKRDRDGRVDGYLTAHLPDECLLVFFRKGEAVNAASLHSSGRQGVTIPEAAKRVRAAGAERVDQYVPGAVLAHRGRSGEGIPRRGEAPRPEGQRRHPRAAPGDRYPVGRAWRRNTGCGRAARGARRRPDGLVAAAAPGRRGHHARDGAQDSARGDARASLRAASGGNLPATAVAPYVETCSAACTSWPHRS